MHARLSTRILFCISVFVAISPLSIPAFAHPINAPQHANLANPAPIDTNGARTSVWGSQPRQEARRSSSWSSAARARRANPHSQVRFNACQPAKRPKATVASPQTLMPQPSSDSRRPSATASQASPSSTGSVSPFKSGGMVMAGYWPEWSAATLPPDSIDFSKFDLINFAFALPTETLNISFSSDASVGLLSRLVTAAHANKTKVGLSIGGWQGSTYFSPAVRTAASRATFIGNLVRAYTAYSLDALDIDWEYPNSDVAGNTQTDAQDADNFQTFLGELRAALPRGALITAAVSHMPFLGSDAQPVRNVSRAAAALDMIVIMNYDVWGSSTSPGPNAPLANLCGNSTQPSASAAAGVRQWVAAGMPRSKILLGVPSYGYVSRSTQRTLVQRDVAPPRHERVSHVEPQPQPQRQSQQRPRSSGEVTSSTGSTSDGQINFNALVSQGVLAKGSDGLFDVPPGSPFVKYWDDCSDTPYLSSGGQVVTYDDPSSLRDKGAFAARAGLAGVNMWSVDGDTAQWDLVRALVRGMRGA